MVCELTRGNPENLGARGGQLFPSFPLLSWMARLNTSTHANQCYIHYVNQTEAGNGTLSLLRGDEATS
jgi:hypothetical protein